MTTQDSIEYSDRYTATGITPNGCDGPCEGMGTVPVTADDEDPALAARWREKDAQGPADEIGYHFVPCPTCRP